MIVTMVDTVEISRVNIRDNLSVDVSVWMNHPDDWDFRPSLSCSGNEFQISDIILSLIHISEPTRRM